MRRPSDQTVAVRFPGSLVVALAIFAATACSPTGVQPSSGAATTSPAMSSMSPAAVTSKPSAKDAATIVGEWAAHHDCAQIKAMLEAAGLEEFVAESIFGNNLVPGVTSEAEAPDPSNLCEGAVEREHSHFFTADGRFGSRDHNGNQVDDGRYELVGDDTVVINDRTAFRYTIDGDQLTLTPPEVDISDCTTKECRFAKAWVLMVAMPGSTWTRVR